MYGRGKRASSLVALLAALAALILAPGAGAAIYWPEYSRIVAARSDGSGIDPNFFLYRWAPTGPYVDLEATSTHLFWRGVGGIESLGLDGPATPPAVVVPGVSDSGLSGLGVGSGYVFWTIPQRQSIGRAALDGSGRIDDLITVDGYGTLNDVAVHGDFIYWAHGNGIARARLDGSEVNQFHVSTFTGGGAIAVDDEHIYWVATDLEGIARADLAGGGVEPDFISATGRVAAIAAIAGTVYWVEKPEGMAYERIGRAVPGQAPTPGLIQTSTFSGGGLAVDARAEPTPRPFPSLPIRFGQLRRNEKRGTAVLDVWVPERGELELTSPAIGWKVLKGPEPPPYRGGNFRWRLKLWPGKSGEASARIRRQLARRGRAPLTLRVSYAETGQLAVTATKKLALRKKLPARLGRRSVGHHR